MERRGTERRGTATYFADRVRRRLILDGDVDFFDIDAFMVRLGQSNVTREFGWDAENRLIGVTPTVDPDNVPTPLPKKVTYVYDYLGRRVERKVFLWNTSGRAWSTTASEHTRYVWGGAAPSGGWLLLMELNASNQAVKKYTWGLDLAGQAGAGAGGPASGRSSSGFLESAGGIGGLLAVEDLDDGAVGGDPVGSFLFCYDGNGNVGQLVDWSAGNVTAALVAKYEYDPYGALIGPDANQDGVFDPVADLTATARSNPIRFSTKYWDDETGLGYWGERYYSAKLGRWVSRDPIEEKGGFGLYRYSANTPLVAYDAFGELTLIPVFPVLINAHDIVELWCYNIYKGMSHCDVRCTSATGSFIGGGTGPAAGSSGSGPGGGENPGWITKPGIPAGAVLAGATLAPLGTCACISKKGAAINGINGKQYRVPGGAGGRVSNSSALLSTLLRCCGVSLSPASPGLTFPGWGDPVIKQCNQRICVAGGEATPVWDECPIDCGDL